MGLMDGISIFTDMTSTLIQWEKVLFSAFVRLTGLGNALALINGIDRQHLRDYNVVPCIGKFMTIRKFT